MDSGDIKMNLVPGLGLTRLTMRPTVINYSLYGKFAVIKLTSYKENRL